MFNSTNGTPFTMNVAPTGNGGYGNGMFGDGAWWIIILLIFCWGGFGANGYGNAGAAENYVLASDFATLQRQIDTASTNTNNLITANGDALQRQVTSIGNGISSLGYDQLNQINGVNNNIVSSTYDVRNAIQNSDVLSMQNTNAINAGITSLGTQIASCCCDQRYENSQNFATLNYNLADQSCQTRRTVQDATRDIITNQDANTRSILDFLTQDKISSLTAENAALKAAANNASQTYDIVSQLRTPSPIPAYVVSNPYCNCNSCCGCNC